MIPSVIKHILKLSIRRKTIYKSFFMDECSAKKDEKYQITDDILNINHKQKCHFVLRHIRFKYITI